MVQAYRTDDPWSGVARGYGLGNALRDDVTRSRAGSAIAGGDYAGGANALLTNGNIESGLRVQDYGQRQDASRAAADKATEEEGLKFTAEMAGRLAEIHRSTKDVNKTLEQFDAVAGQFAKYDTPQEIAALRQQIATDPDNTLIRLGAGAAKQLGYDVQGSGDEVLVIDKSTGKLVNRYRGARTTSVPEGGALYEIPGEGSETPAPAGAEDAGAAALQSPAVPASAEGQADPEAVWQAAIMQESGGRAGVLGPQTDYGRAEGLTQMLPATAEAMARKLGVAWNPALMRENSPKAKAYQEKLGRAYFEEGLEKYGNVEDALRYYHGGPNQELWGPKTEAHVKAVMGRVQPYEVAANGPTPAPGGARLIVQRPKAPKETTRPATASEKAAYGIGADVPAQIKPDGSIDVISGTGATLKKVPAQVQSGYVDNRKALSQIDAAIKAIQANPGALGLKNKLGDDIMQRVDPGGVDARAMVSNIGSLLIHDRSGAAVTAAEQPRLKPFVPKADDTAESAIKKLQLLKEQYAANNSEIETVFGEDAGYAGMGGAGQGAKAPGANPALEAAKAAIAKGAPRDAVIKRLRENGIDPAGL